ncbi:hypothetical protein SSE37_01675 [Sagittula stellata E-37]|uniref:Sulfatase-modifying factor enzyme-like domain-containing protein n=2 Tax=Sagittula stellata TaxID=52603 RepID=A3K4M3_SAGS3|nr:hypothetical protein SSE37_01675 [Sagittula stellata E-37]
MASQSGNGASSKCEADLQTAYNEIALLKADLSLLEEDAGIFTSELKQREQQVTLLSMDLSNTEEQNDVLKGELDTAEAALDTARTDLQDALSQGRENQRSMSRIQRTVAARLEGLDIAVNEDDDTVELLSLLLSTLEAQPKSPRTPLPPVDTSDLNCEAFGFADFVAVPPKLYDLSVGDLSEYLKQVDASNVEIDQGFCVQRKDVTNAEFKAFFDDLSNGHRDALDLGAWTPIGRDSDSATSLSYTQAVAYADWLSTSHDETVSLPTRDQWFAALAVSTRLSNGDLERSLKFETMEWINASPCDVGYNQVLGLAERSTRWGPEACLDENLQSPTLGFRVVVQP